MKANNIFTLEQQLDNILDEQFKITPNTCLKGAKEYNIQARMFYSLYSYDNENIDVFPYFSRTAGLKKVCDYIIFAEKAEKQGNSLFILLIELKSGQSTNALKQLNASETFIKYLLDSAERVEKKICDKNNVRIVKICLKEQNKRTKVKSTKQSNNIYTTDTGVINYTITKLFDIEFILKYYINNFT